MAEDREPVMTGGCQCGAVRYAFYAQPIRPHICHCRMCQKAFGNYFAAFVVIRHDSFAWTRGSIGVFKSSDVVERGFCRDCGTPLSFQYAGSRSIGISSGSLDEPGRIQPEFQTGVESQVPAFAILHTLPAKTTQESTPSDLLSQIRSRQHPDHD